MKNLWILITAGIILRVFLAFSTFHTDILAFDLSGKFIATGNILNIYDLSSDQAVFNYPPLIYWFHGLFHIIPFSGYGFVKLPYLIFDLLIVFVLLKLLPSPNQAKLAAILWLFNPVNLYATYMMGQFDIIPVFFTILSIYYIAKDRLYLAALALGGGIAFKLYPIFLLLPLLLLGKTYFIKFKILSLAALPYLLSILPYLGSSSFKSTALFASQSSKSLYAVLPVSGGESILLFPAALVFFYLFIWKRGVEKFTFWKISLIPLLLFFIFTHFHPQWLIWITPMLILDLVVNKFKNLLPVMVIFISWIASLFFFDPSLTIKIFSPLFPGLDNIPNNWALITPSIDFNFARSIFQTLLASAMIFLIYEYASKRENA